MKVLFILNESTMHERMGIMCLSSALKERGHTVRLVLIERLGRRAIEERIDRDKPDIIAYSAMTGEHADLLEFNRVLKKKFCFVSVFGGPCATFFPDLINEDGVDAICVGEADRAFPEFCSRMGEGGEHWKTPNFLCRHQDVVFRNPPMPLIEDLDSLPFPDRALMYEADPPLLKEGHKMFFAGRGCPQKCSYCFNSTYNELYKNKGAVVRLRSPENIILEIIDVKSSYPLNVVWIDDDNFLAKPRTWLANFAKLYKEKVGLPLSINIRANFITENMISCLKDAGLDSVWMGVECGNEEKANVILKREMTNAANERAAALLHQYKIKFITQNLIGLPVSDSFETDLETLDFNIRLQPTFGWASILYPYPGTAIETYAKEHGFLEGKARLLETNKRSTAFHFSAAEARRINNLHKLFGLIVRFPFLRKHVDRLCSLPMDALYVVLFYVWYGYNIKFRIYPFISLREEIMNYIVLCFKFVKKT